MNPFIYYSSEEKTEYVTSRCSLNRAVMQKLPLYGIEDELEGLIYKDIFSTPLLVEEIRRVSRRFGIDLSNLSDRQLPFLVDEGLVSGDMRRRQMAEHVVKRFGARLGLLLLALRMGEKENRLARPEWDDACWDYWRDLDTVILTGGLASSMLGRRFKEYIHRVFDRAGERCYHIRLFDNGSYLGIMGLAQRLLSDNTAALVFDMGHTGWKRALVRMGTGEIAGFTPMESLPSRYMENRFDNPAEQLRLAIELHRYIVNTVASSYRELTQKLELCDTVLISIANYTCGGVLDSEHGGYAKLSLLNTDYGQLLEEELSDELHRMMNVRLVHDATATALYFNDIRNAACITLGTGFGVGFPEIRIG